MGTKCNDILDYPHKNYKADPKYYEFAPRDSGKEPVCVDCLIAERLSKHPGALKVEKAWQGVTSTDRDAWLKDHEFIVPDLEWESPEAITSMRQGEYGTMEGRTTLIEWIGLESTYRKLGEAIETKDELALILIHHRLLNATKGGLQWMTY